MLKKLLFAINPAFDKSLVELPKAITGHWTFLYQFSPKTEPNEYFPKGREFEFARMIFHNTYDEALLDLKDKSTNIKVISIINSCFSYTVYYRKRKNRFVKKELLPLYLEKLERLKKDSENSEISNKTDFLD